MFFAKKSAGFNLDQLTKKIEKAKEKKLFLWKQCGQHSILG